MREIIIISFAFFLQNSLQTDSDFRDIRKNVTDIDKTSSLAFIFDTTGSMYDDLKQLREGAELILTTALEESDFIEDFVFVPFNDPVVGPATVTKDKAVFKAALDNVTVRGGGDCPEKSAGAIALGLHASRPRSFLYVFTDASAGDYALATPLLDLVQRTQSQVVFILTGHCNDLDQPSFKIYQQLAAASSGQVFNLNKTNVHQVLDFVRNSIRGRSVNLGSAVIPAGHNYTQAVPVDSTLAEVTVSVSGSKPQIKVVNPKGEEIRGPPQLITTLDLTEIMVVKVLQPEPGNWTITTGSDADHSVKVVGLSNLTFNHGFSVQKPASLLETSYRPLQGTYNYMTISLTQSDVPVKLKYAEMLALNGTTLFEINLKEYDAERQTYIADPFLPPDDFFYIAINGVEENNQEVRRIGATAIQAKAPDVPYLTVKRKVEAHIHDRVVLRCIVESLVPVVAMWTKEGSQMKAHVTSLQSTVVEYVIENIGVEDADTYTCAAQNAAGISRATTEVSVLVNPPQVTIIAPLNQTLQSGANLTVMCSVLSEAYLWKFQFIFNGIKSQEAIDIPIELNEEGLYKFNKSIIGVTDKNTGNYSCVAANAGGKTIQSSYIIIQSRPTAQILGPHTLSRPIHTNIQLICHVENVEKVVWISPNRTKVKMYDVSKNLDAILDLVNATLEDDGVWTCDATGGSDTVSDSVQISLLMKPFVSIEEPRNVTILNGTTYDITCNVVAKPEPRIIWHRETERFLNNTITLIELNTYKSVLTLDSTKEAVNSTYFCFGENSQGIDQDSATVNVRRKMKTVKGFQDSLVNLYTETIMECITDSFPEPVIKWYHNGTLVEENENVRISENGNALMINRIDFDNLGDYKCEIDNGFDKMTIGGKLSLIGLDKPRLIKIPTTIITRKGMEAIITCSVLKGNPNPTIKWFYKDYHSENFKTVLEDIVFKNHNLNIQAVDVKHEGIYKCIAENIIGKDEYEVNLVVQYPPEITNHNEEENEVIEIKRNEKVALSCKAIGFPPPVVVWNKDDMPVTYSRNVHITDKNELVIEKVNKNDAGVYTCNVISPLGTAQKNITLAVYVPPTISPGVDSQIEVLEGQLVELPCNTEGLPKPEVIWLQNKNVVNERRKFIDDFGLRFVANLTDFGEYTCFVRNKYGNSSISYNVLIWVPPYIEPPLETKVDTIIGVNASLKCNAVGFPVPVIKWEFNGKVLIENSTQLNFDDIGNLFVNYTSSDLEGYYSCIAENIAGVAIKTILLNVYEPPKILPDGYNGPYIGTNKDVELLISCNATGKPKPYILWSRDDYYLDKDSRYEIEIDGSLKIKSPSEDLSGFYTCIAKNIVGLANKTVEINIYPLPTQMQNDEALNTFTVLEGENTTVDCPARTSDTDVVKWYKDAKLISEGMLLITNATPKNTLIYACVASNLVGSAYSKIAVNVEYPPKMKETNLDERLEAVEFISDDENELEIPFRKTLEELKLENYNENNSDKSGRLFDIKIENKEVIKGGDLYFDCDVDAKPNPKIKWYFKSKPILGEDKNRLKIMNVKIRHSGTYKCVASNAHGTVVKEFYLDVLEPPFISEFDLLDVELKEGANATFDCNAKGAPQPVIEWTSNTTNYHIENSTLIITNVSTNSEGLYRCDAKNKAGAAFLVYRVNVVEPAAVKEVVLYKDGVGGTVVDRVEVVLSKHVRLSCTAKGKPLPSIQWLKNGKVLSHNLEGISYTDIVFEKVKTTDAGVYVCFVASESGLEEKKIKLEVLEPPRIFQTVFQNSNSSSDVTNLEVISGQAFYLHCHPYGNPVPEIYWFRDGAPLRFFDDTMISTEYSEVIVVKEAIYAQTGNYTCIARNRVGEARIVYLVDVLVPPPTPKESTKQVTVRVGNKLFLRCPIDGSPLPVVIWVKHPYIEIGQATPRIKLEDDNSTLIINHTQVSDSGKYSCVMTNKVGTTEAIFEVIVEKQPSITGDVGVNGLEKHVVPLLWSIILKCQVDGNPFPKISWLKDTQPLTQGVSNAQLVLGNSTLTIWSVSIRDAGQYICLAENSAGSAHKRFQIVIKVPGKWSAWSRWSFCNVTCGSGYQHRTRVCQYVDDNNVTYDKTTKSEKVLVDETVCRGSVHDRRKCQMPPCEENELEDQWSSWSSWSKCSASCGVGSQTRVRRCRKGRCTGDNVQIRKCPDLPKCQTIRETSKNEVFSDFKDTSSYIPAATLEMTHPDVVIPNVETIHTKPELQYTPANYDANVTDNIDGSDRGPCEPGYKENNTTAQCEDIDECLLDKNKCHSTQVCVNTAGGYQCTCQKGFTALGIGQRCLDINECAQGIDGCEFACVNVAGGYVCACPKQLRLHTDRHRCVDPTTSARKRYSYEDIENEDLLSTTIDFPARYMKNKH